MNSVIGVPEWWTPPLRLGTDQDLDAGWDDAQGPAATAGDQPVWRHSTRPRLLDDGVILAPLKAQFGQLRSRDRVRDLAEVFTHQREVDAILDLIPDAFMALDVKFLEPSCGSGNFLTEVLRRKLRLVAKADCVSQEQYEQRLLRAVASIYGLDISPENVSEARGRMAHGLLEHYQTDASTIEPTAGFLNAAALIPGDNIVLGDTVNASDQIELCDWRPHPGGRFQRVWTHALVPPADRHLFWFERVQDDEPVHYSEFMPPQQPSRPPPNKTKAGR